MAERALSIESGPTTAGPESTGHTDIVDQAHCLINDTLMRVMIEGHARHKIGLTHMSPLIADRPGWYIWTDNRDGAYLLELINAEPAGSADKPLVTADFLVRYYPSPEESVFNGFSEIERETRQKNLFDKSGTPRYENQHEIDESLYAVGAIQLVFDNDAGFMLIRAFALNHAFYIDEGGKSRKETPHRKLTWELLDKLLLGLCYVRRGTPADVKLVNTNGPSHWGLEIGISWNNANSDNSTCTDPGIDMEQVLGTIDRQKELRMERFDTAPEPKHEWINSDWWQASSWDFPPDTEITHRCFTDH